MKQEDKLLLIKDLCVRLPYGVKADDRGEIITIRAYHPSGIIDDFGIMHNIENIKPYLFPLSSMTEDQSKIYHELIRGMFGTSALINIEEFVDWCNKNHLDYRGLIEKGLALDATELNIY